MKTFKIKDYIPPQEPPVDLDELVARFLMVEQGMFQKSRPSDLRKQVSLNSAEINEIKKQLTQLRGGEENGK
jgi:hypothetical protein